MKWRIGQKIVILWFFNKTRCSLFAFRCLLICGTKAETAHMDLKMLIERVKADDADALNTIYETYVPMMRNAVSYTHLTLPTICSV